MFDLYHFSFNVSSQIPQPDLPGVLVYPPPKNGSRGRDGDLMILFLSLTGKNPYSPDDLAALLQRSAQAYYQSSGSLTAGMRAAAEICNAQLLERNLKNAREAGGQVIGRLHLGILRGNTLLIAVSGPAHAFVLGSREVQPFYDAQAGRGLGLGAAIGLRYFQTQIQAGDVLVFSPEPPSEWTPESLAGCPALTLEHLRRRLLNNTGSELQALVVKFQSGVGEIHALRHRSAGPISAAEPAPSTPMPGRPAGAPVPSTPPSQPAALRVPSTPTPGSARPSGAQAAATPTPVRPAGMPVPSAPPPQSSGPAPAETQPAAATTPMRPLRPPVPTGTVPTRSAATPTPSTPEPPLPATAASAPESQPDPAEREISQAAALEAARLARQRRIERKKQAAAAWAGWKGFSARVSQGWRDLLNRLAPQRAARPASVSPALLAFIAIAIPLVVVAISLTVYLRVGQGERRATLYQEAVQWAIQAQSEKDPTLQRSAWTRVLETLDKVDGYGITKESQDLRRQAQLKVDAGDAILRVEFKRISQVGLASTVKITRMVANGDDLYLLDASNGSVMRFFLTAQGYELDSQFNCRPGPAETLIISAIIDLAPMPAVNKYNATIAALDAGGNLLYCIPGKAPTARPLAAPNVGWGKIAGIRLVRDTLYVLDTLNNAIWRYSGNDLIFQDRPSLYSEKFNTLLSNAVDFTLYEDWVYFLKKDGRMIQCKISRVADIPTRCTDPAVFTDSRTGREPNPTWMPGTRFTQLQSINAPDPALYILDANQAAVYRFSVVLNFQDQMRSAGTALPRRDPTAFTITTRRVVFLAYASEVFMAQMP